MKIDLLFENLGKLYNIGLDDMDLIIYSSLHFCNNINISYPPMPRHRHTPIFFHSNKELELSICEESDNIIFLYCHQRGEGFLIERV